MKKWSMPLIIAIVALLMAMSPANVSAGEGASLSITKAADKDSAYLGDNITYTIIITNTGNVTLVADNITDTLKGNITSHFSDNLTVGASKSWSYTYTVKDDDPDPLENTVEAHYLVEGLTTDISASDNCSVDLIHPSITVTKEADKTSASLHETITYTYTVRNIGDVTVDNITLVDDKLGPISLDGSDNTTLASGENITATATYTIDMSDLIAGLIVNTANVTGTDPTGESVFATSDPVLVSVTINKTLMTKAEILKLSGVPGKGIDTAPGLQKPFNPKSKAAEHAGKKNQAYDEEATDDGGEAKLKMKKLKTRSRIENQAYDEEATHDKDKPKPKIKKQLKIRSRAENHP